MQSKPFRMGPIAITNAVANILNPGTTTGGVNSTPSPYNNLRILINHIRVVNKTNAVHTISMWIGATGGSAGGSEFGFNATAVPANSAIDFYPPGLIFDTVDFLTAQADANTALTVTMEGEIMVA